jgi:hypothetical protein
MIMTQLLTRMALVMLLGGGACTSSNHDEASVDSTAISTADAGDRAPAAGSARSASAERGVIWQGTTGSFDIRWDSTDVLVTRAARPERSGNAEGATFLSFRAELDTAMDTGHDPASDTVGSVCAEEYDYAILSAVGHILGVQQRHYSYCEGMPHPSITVSYVAIDLERSEREGVHEIDGSELIGREIALTDLFSEKDVLQALLGDRLVQKRLAALGMDPGPIASVDHLVALLEGGTECEYGFERDMLRRWAFHHVEGDRVAVRIGLSHGCEAAQGMLTQIGILLPVPEALRDDLAAVAKGTRGLLMREAAKRFEGKTTHIAYRYRFDETEGGVD